MTGLELKRFISRICNIPQTKLRTRAGRNFSAVLIVMEPRVKHSDPMIYAHSFPDTLGNRCMRIVYRGHPNLEAQNWGGNVGRHDIAMSPSDWAELAKEYSEVQ